MDVECVALCKLLNRMPTVVTVDSCCGHLERPYMIWFLCNSVPVLSRLGRATERNYSDGKWEVIVTSCDTMPYGFFGLVTKEPFKSYEEMYESVKHLIEDINHWCKDEFDEYFYRKNTTRKLSALTN